MKLTASACSPVAREFAEFLLADPGYRARIEKIFAGMGEELKELSRFGLLHFPNRNNPWRKNGRMRKR